MIQGKLLWTRVDQGWHTDICLRLWEAMAESGKSTWRLIEFWLSGDSYWRNESSTNVLVRAVGDMWKTVDDLRDAVGEGGKQRMYREGCSSRETL